FLGNTLFNGFDPADTFYAPAQVSSTIRYDYAGGQYLNASVTLDGKVIAAVIPTTSKIRSLTKYDGSVDQKQVLTLNFLGNTTFNGFDPADTFYDPAQVSSTIRYSYAE